MNLSLSVLSHLNKRKKNKKKGKLEKMNVPLLYTSEKTQDFFKSETPITLPVPLFLPFQKLCFLFGSIKMCRNF